MIARIGINDSGKVIGQYHPRAVLTDNEVAQLVKLYEQGFGYRRLAVIFEISRSAVRNICKGRARCQTATRFKEVKR